MILEFQYHTQRFYIDLNWFDNQLIFAAFFLVFCFCNIAVQELCPIGIVYDDVMTSIRKHLVKGYVKTVVKTY